MRKSVTGAVFVQNEPFPRVGTLTFFVLPLPGKTFVNGKVPSYHARGKETSYEKKKKKEILNRNSFDYCDCEASNASQISSTNALVKT